MEVMGEIEEPFISLGVVLVYLDNLIWVKARLTDPNCEVKLAVQYCHNPTNNTKQNNLVGVVLLSVKTHHTTTTTDVITF